MSAYRYIGDGFAYAVPARDITAAEFDALNGRQRRIVLARALRRHDITVAGADVIELGPGTGFYVQLWERWGAKSVTGLDIGFGQRQSGRAPVDDHADGSAVRLAEGRHAEDLSRRAAHGVSLAEGPVGSTTRRGLHRRRRAADGRR